MKLSAFSKKDLATVRPLAQAFCAELQQLGYDPLFYAFDDYTAEDWQWIELRFRKLSNQERRDFRALVGLASRPEGAACAA